LLETLEPRVDLGETFLDTVHPDPSVAAPDDRGP
jgi:hypothetical protein